MKLIGVTENVDLFLSQQLGALHVLTNITTGNTVMLLLDHILITQFRKVGVTKHCADCAELEILKVTQDRHTHHRLI